MGLPHSLRLCNDDGANGDAGAVTKRNINLRKPRALRPTNISRNCSHILSSKKEIKNQKKHNFEHKSLRKFSFQFLSGIVKIITTTITKDLFLSWEIPFARKVFWAVVANSKAIQNSSRSNCRWCRVEQDEKSSRYKQIPFLFSYVFYKSKWIDFSLLCIHPFVFFLWII